MTKSLKPSWKIKSNKSNNNKKPNKLHFYIFELLLPFSRNILLHVARTREKGKQVSNNPLKRYTWYIVNENKNETQFTCDKFEKVGFHLLFTIKYLHPHHRKRIAKIPNFCRYSSNIHIIQGNDVLFLHQISVFWKFSLILKGQEDHKITVSNMFITSQ